MHYLDFDFPARVSECEYVAFWVWRDTLNSNGEITAWVSPRALIADLVHNLTHNQMSADDRGEFSADENLLISGVVQDDNIPRIIWDQIHRSIQWG